MQPRTRRKKRNERWTGRRRRGGLTDTTGAAYLEQTMSQIPWELK